MGRTRILGSRRVSGEQVVAMVVMWVVVAMMVAGSLAPVAGAEM